MLDMRTAAATLLCCALSVRRRCARDEAIFARMCSRAAHPHFSGTQDGLCSPHRCPFAQSKGVAGKPRVGRNTIGGSAYAAVNASDSSTVACFVARPAWASSGRRVRAGGA